MNLEFLPSCRNSALKTSMKKIKVSQRFPPAKTKTLRGFLWWKAPLRNQHCKNVCSPDRVQASHETRNKEVIFLPLQVTKRKKIMGKGSLKVTASENT